MEQLVHLVLTPPHGNVYAPLLKVHPLSYVNLWQLLQDECVHVMWIPVVFQPLLLAVLSIGRAIAKILSDDIQMAAGPLQLCAGHQSGCESAVHAMRQVFESSVTEAIILVDATNAFNSLNRQTALRNIRHLCPALSKVLINTYWDDVRLYINGETMLSQEGTTQGDPFAMAMYAIAVNPLIHRLKQDTTKQIWFADDATAGGKLNCANGGTVLPPLAQTMATSQMH